MEIPIDTGIGDASSDAVAFLEQMTNGVFHEDINAFVDATFLEGSNEFETRCVAYVGQPWEGVTAKVSLIDEVVWCSVEHSTPLFEFTDSVRGFLGVEFGHSPVSKPLASLHCVVEVDLPTVSRIGILEGCCAATFRHDGVCLAEQGLGDHGGFGTAACCFDCRS